MKPIARVLEPEQYANAAFVSHQEMEVMMEIAAFISGRELQQGDEKRISRHQVTGEPGTYIIFWDEIRKGILYSGPELNKAPGDLAPSAWLIFYIPEQDLI